MSTNARRTRAVLRDLLRRLDVLTVKCGGKEPESGPAITSSDDFINLQMGFEHECKSIRDDIHERNSVMRQKGGQMAATELSHRIRKSLVSLAEDLTKMNDMNNDLLREIGRKKMKPKKKDRIEELERNLNDRCHIYQKLLGEMEVLSQMSMESEKKGKQAAYVAGGNVVKTKRGKLMDLDLDNVGPGSGGGGAGGRPSGNGDVEMEMDDMGKQQMQIIQRQDLEINKQLDAVTNVVRRLQEQAVQMGMEVDAQGIALDEIAAEATKADETLKTLNRKLAQITKKMKPGNCILNICCLLLLLGLIGYIVMRFRNQLGF